MDQFKSNQESSPFTLPEVQPDNTNNEQAYENNATNIDEVKMAKAVEKNTMANPLTSLPPQSSSQILVNPQAATDMSLATDQTPTSKKIVVTDNLPASDADLIEKAWVLKAKAIVEQTRNDPYEQSNEISKMRDDYKSKRFNINLNSADKE